MRIGLVIRDYDALGGGAERWTDRHARALLARGHEVHLFAATFRGTPPNAFCRRLEIGSVARHERRLAFAAAAESVVSHLSLDVVHDMGDTWTGNLFMPHHGTRAGGFARNTVLLPPMLRWTRPLATRWLPRYREFAELERLQFEPAAGRRIIALSEMVRDDMIRFHGVERDSIHVIHNGVDVERFTPDSSGLTRCWRRGDLGVHDETVFLIVAHNFRLKGLAPLLRAFARLLRSERKVALWIVGGGSIPPYRRLARKLGCAGATWFLGSQTDPRPFYQAADVYVQPTYYDPCSLVALEALASGLPTITTRYNGAGELIVSGQEGFVLDEPDDDRALTDAMSAFLDHDRRREASRAARSLAERHSLDRNLSQIEAVYGEIAPRRAAA